MKKIETCAQEGSDGSTGSTEAGNTQDQGDVAEAGCPQRRRHVEPASEGGWRAREEHVTQPCTAVRGPPRTHFSAKTQQSHVTCWERTSEEMASEDQPKKALGLKR